MKYVIKFYSKSIALMLIFFMNISGIVSAQKVAIIDAGSSGSRLYVYEVDLSSQERIKRLFPKDEAEKTKCRGRALSQVPNQTDSVRAYLQTMTAKYPCDKADLYVLATAGMRLQPKEAVGSVYKAMRSLGTINGYDVKSAMTISGQYEGLYGWLAANFLNGKIEVPKSVFDEGLKFKELPYGILEIGGASLQLAFPTSAKHADCLFRRGLGYIYSRSYLGGGVDQVYEKNRNTLNYNFSVKFEDVSSLYPRNLNFWGLSIPVNLVLKGMDEAKEQKNYEAKINAYIRTFDGFTDTDANYHPRMNAYYIKNVFHDLGLENRIQSPRYDASWTIGAALDILFYKKNPEGYNY